MALTQYNRPDWEDVYLQAAALRQLAPWDVLQSEAPFKVESPYGEQAGWCSFMGNGGEVFGLNIYLGHQGFTVFHNLRQSGTTNMPDYFSHTIFFSQPIIQVEFTNPNELDKSDKAKHKALGISASGRLNGIKVRKQLPGGIFGELPDDDLPFVADCLEQCAVVTNMVAKNAGFLSPTDQPKPEFLVRRGRETSTGADYTTTFEPGYATEWRFQPDNTKLDSVLEVELASLPRADKTVLYHFQFLYQIIAPSKKIREYRPLMGVFLDKGTAFAHQMELFRYATLENSFAGRFCRQLQQLGYIPSKIIVGPDLAVDLLIPIAAALHIKLEQKPMEREFIELSESMGRQF